MPSARAMEHSLPAPLLSRFSEFLAERVGLSFPQERWGDLERAVQAAATELGYEDARSCLQWLPSSPPTTRQVEILASHLTVGETYFFREKAAFAALEHHILPDLIRCRRETERRIRIWSAGCSTGEEPYSIAIALGRLLPDLKDWNITILATDINPRFLRKAARGLYGDWSFRDATPGLKEECFKRTKEGLLEIAPYLKALVSFAYLNLADDVYPSVESTTNAMDIIFCRNVLMYFEPGRAKAVIEKLCRSLVEGGWLIVSPIETSLAALPQLISVRLPGLILFRKDTRPVREGQTEEDVPLRPAGGSGAALELPACAETNAPARPGQADPIPVPAEAQGLATREQAYREASDRYAQGRYAEAAEAAEALLSRDSEDVRAMALLARAYANQGRLADALAWCNKAIAADKLNPAWPYLLASILQEGGQAEEAIAALKRTLYLDHDCALAYFALGSLMRRQGRHRESLKHFRNALAILGGYRDDHVLPESEGITAGRLAEIIRSTVSNEVPASTTPD